jgi:chitodextrinase
MQNKMITIYNKKRPHKSILILLVVMVTSATVGIVETFRSKAAESITVSGYMFEDINRNGILDNGEAPWGGKTVYICDKIANTSCLGAATDTNGFYSQSGLAPSNYKVQLDPSNWWNIYNDWTPTTSKLLPEFTQDISSSVSLNFGFRPITYSADSTNIGNNAPVSTFTPQSGSPIVKVYNDAITAEEVYKRLSSGSLISSESLKTTIYYGSKDSSNFTSFNLEGSEEGCKEKDVPSSAGVYINFKDSFGSGGGAGTIDNVLFHEYGHAWSLYWACTHGDPFFTEYLQIRSISNDARLNTTHAWSTREMIAEDYRQLFGDSTAAAGSQENQEIPAAKDVQGLKDYLMSTLMTPRSNTIPTAPSNLTVTPTISPEGADAKLSWAASTDNTGIKTYSIYRNNQLIDIVNSPSTTFVDTGLKASTTYSYYVKASDAYGNLSPNSNTVTITIPSSTSETYNDTTAPTAPTNLATTTITSTSIGIKWNASTDNKGVAGYKIYRIDGRKSSPLLIGTVIGTNYNATGLKNNTSYSFYVQAIDASSNVSAPSATLTVKTKTR